MSLTSSQPAATPYFELVLIMMLITVLPYYPEKRGWPIVVSSALTTGIVAAKAKLVIPWQDLTDLILFYCFCFVVIRLKRLWLTQSVASAAILQDTNLHLKQSRRTDELTGLLNRTALREDFSAFPGRTLCIAMIDLDHFKRDNDRFGHMYGDDILKTFANCLQQYFPPEENSVYRYGGDEFLVITDTGSAGDFRLQLENVQHSFARAGKNGEHETISCGYITGRPADEMELRTCLRLADDCLYSAKASGKNCIRSRKFTSKAEGEAIREDEGSSKDIDNVTGLLHLSAFLDRCQEAELKPHEWCMIFFDIDRFQEFNKYYTYQVGDILLGQIAKILQDTFGDSLTGSGGEDHFVVMTYDPDPSSRIQRVQQQAAMLYEKHFIFLRAGVYRHEGGKPVPPLKQVVDMAKYASNRLRRQSALAVMFYDEKMEKERREETYVLNNFDSILQSGGIIPYFQPIAGALTGRCCGFEALARWKDPKGDLISPAVFIPVLEKSHDNYRLDFCMLRKVCEVLQEMDADRLGNLFVSVNFSRTDFDICDVPAKILEIVDSFGVPHSAIRVEITESSFADNAKVREAVQKIHDNGFRVWLDDFGSGTSSLNILEEYQIDGAKLDLVFLRHFSSGEKSRVIIRSLIRLCHDIGVMVVMEGVETQEQLDFIRAAGGNYIQGFFYSRPLPPEELSSTVFWKDYAPRKETLYYRAAADINLDAPSSFGSAGRSTKTLVFEERGGYSPVSVSEKDTGLMAPQTVRFLRMNDEMHHFLRKIYSEEELRNSFREIRLPDGSVFRSLQVRREKDGGWTIGSLVVDGKRYFLQQHEIARYEDRKAILIQVIEMVEMAGS